MSMVRNRIRQALTETAAELLETPAEDVAGRVSIEIEIPKLAQHGDFATNLAMSLSRFLRRKPRDIAAQIVSRLDQTLECVDHIEIAGPGFINLFVKARAWHQVLHDIARQCDRYGCQDLGSGRRVQVEFVSANPTGPLHIGHGRGAAVGDVLAAVLGACGYQVDREYYINDAGNQMTTLGRSLYFRYLEQLGEPVRFPEQHYQGEYLRDLARDLVKEVGDRYRGESLEEVLPEFSRYAGDRILEGIRDDLETFGVRYQSWFSEQSLHDRDEVVQTIGTLEQQGHVYLADGAKWFRSTAFGDEKDRVVLRANGLSTYLAGDLAYHKNKYQRGYDLVVDVWGADHHGYIERMLAGVQALGRERQDLRIVLVQLVNLLRGGKPVAMSTRAGEFVTLREVLGEVGKDAARFLFLTRRSDSPLDFDLEVAKAQTNENPVYYVQYAHARLCSIFEVAAERGAGFRWPRDVSDARIERLDLPQELELLKLLGEFPEVLAGTAQSLEPHRLPYYLQDLVTRFHNYYSHNRILGDDPQLTLARLCLAGAVRTVIRNALGLLGVSAPEKM